MTQQSCLHGCLWVPWLSCTLGNEAGCQYRKGTCLPIRLLLKQGYIVLLSQGDISLYITVKNQVSIIITVLKIMSIIFALICKDLCWRIVYDVTPSSNKGKIKNLVQPEKYFLNRKLSTVWIENHNHLPNVNTGAKWQTKILLLW